MSTATKRRGKTASEPKEDVYDRVTNKIIEALESGARPWHQPWKVHSAGNVSRPLRFNGERYSGINVLNLWMRSIDKSFVSPYWMTFNQAKELGAHVKKGEKGTSVVYASSFTKTEEVDGEEVSRNINFLKEYTVFCADQIEGLDKHYYAIIERDVDVKRIEHCEEFFRNTQADIRHGGASAYFSPSCDYVQMPPINAFEDSESYYSVLSHEMTHWTKLESRCNRDFGGKKFGDTGYAREELVAELGSAFLCADLGISPEVRDDHAGYLDWWLKILKEDKRAIFNAASHATKAVDFLHGWQPQKEGDA